MSYSEKLKDPRWQKRRLEILNRDNFTCQVCGDTKNTLHVHHKKYFKEPWDAANWALITLCSSCHSREEWLLKNEGRNVSLLKSIEVDVLTEVGYLSECYEGKTHILRSEILAFFKEKRIEHNYYWESDGD